MADDKHGNMDTRAQEKTFAGFLRIAKYASIVIVVLLILLGLANV